MRKAMNNQILRRIFDYAKPVIDSIRCLQINDLQKAGSFLNGLLINIKSPAPHLISLGLLSIIALGDWWFSGLARRTIVFFALEDGAELVEERFVAKFESLDGDIRAFTEEAVLGPSRWDSAPLFDRETVLESLFLREGIVFIGLSEEAVLPRRGIFGDSLEHSLRSLTRDIRRNFPKVETVRYFIAGAEIPDKGS